MQAVRVCRAAAETHVSRRILFLKRLFFFHLVGRFCETPSEYATASDADALQLLELTLLANRDTDAALARRRVTAGE